MNTNHLKQWQEFLETFPKKSFHKGDVLLFQGEAPRWAFVISRGVVKVYNINMQGDEQLVQFKSTFEAIPLSWVYGKSSSAVYYYQALTEGAYYCVGREEYLEFLQANPDLMFVELNRMVTSYVGQTMNLNALLYSRATDKLINTLRYLMLSHGHEVGENVEIMIKLTQQDFANITGLTRETVSIELSKLKKAGVVDYKKSSKYTVNVKKLNNLINDQFVTDVSVKL